MDSFQPDRAQPWSIQSEAAHRLAIAFGLTVADVKADAQDVAAWHGSDADLAAAIGGRRLLDSAATSVYIRKLRSALDE